MEERSGASSPGEEHAPPLPALLRADVLPTSTTPSSAPPAHMEPSHLPPLLLLLLLPYSLSSTTSGLGEVVQVML